jgi:hypothetical protein
MSLLLSLVAHECASVYSVHHASHQSAPKSSSTCVQEHMRLGAHASSTRVEHISRLPHHYQAREREGGVAAGGKGGLKGGLKGVLKGGLEKRSRGALQQTSVKRVSRRQRSGAKDSLLPGSPGALEQTSVKGVSGRQVREAGEQQTWGAKIVGKRHLRACKVGYPSRGRRR